jgi:hypothetical protein
VDDLAVRDPTDRLVLLLFGVLLGLTLIALGWVIAGQGWWR